jgi:hypothetical protein
MAVVWRFQDAISSETAALLQGCKDPVAAAFFAGSDPGDATSSNDSGTPTKKRGTMTVTITTQFR